MISSTRSWFRRNRTNFAIGAGVLGAGYLAGQYVLGKVSEARQRMSEERIAKENLRRRFEQNQEDCTFTVLAILPTATENILDAVPVEQILEELQKHKAERLARSVGPSEVFSSAPPSVADPSVADDDAKSLTSYQSQSESYVHASQIADGENASTTGSGSAEVAAEGAASGEKKTKKSKAQLWNEMKISSISRAFTLLYTLSLLTLLTRIQLNLLGRRNYLASVVSLATPHSQESKINLENHDDDNFDHAYGNDFETNRRYLSLSWWLLHRGCIELIQKVTAAVNEVFGSLNPREEITLERLSEMTLEVRKKVEGATEEQRRTCKWLPYLLPSQDQEAYVLRESGMSDSASGLTSTSLRRLIDETSDLIDSPSFTHVLTRLLDSAFSHLIDTKISQLSYKIPPTSASTARVQEIVNPSDAKAKVANSLAVFCRQAHAIGTGANNEYLAAIESVRDLEAFAAVVYSSNFEYETPEAGASANTATGPESGMQSAAESARTSLVTDVGFESAWGKALAKEDGKA
ncbi:Peroxin-3 family protein [Aaosphaeria arxii CBS 175.79]|uniref:Peroxin-3 family protein n=1 Tax=Aaosphaeria arxii CBS 175.79 TaxID=1450172 RepID=A0A6A5XHV4_9PLEO|nr:Peroxin-3 family protein [Aaosphaeria arxii CBS 175.79]KAF2012437.1 Peroxin-3 family protein [Aaosphaeria arxii CBS 175.79]